MARKKSCKSADRGALAASRNQSCAEDGVIPIRHEREAPTMITFAGGT
jgi:hypothetical protein